MIRDTILLLDIAPYDRAALVQVLKRRISDFSKRNFNLSRNDPDLDADLKRIVSLVYCPRFTGTTHLCVL